MKKIKKRLQIFFNIIGYTIFKFIYGKIKLKIEIPDSEYKILNKRIDKYSYNIFLCFRSRLYTDTINNTAIIRDNKIIENASFQFKENFIDKVENNVVLRIGTPRILKKKKR